MQLERFTAFTDQLCRDSALKQFGEISRIFRRTGDDWFTLTGEAVKDPRTSEVLTRVISENANWRKAIGSI
jgi:hypothetical protein